MVSQIASFWDHNSINFIVPIINPIAVGRKSNISQVTIVSKDVILRSPKLLRDMKILKPTAIWSILQQHIIIANKIWDLFKTQLLVILVYLIEFLYFQVILLIKCSYNSLIPMENTNQIKAKLNGQIVSLLICKRHTASKATDNCRKIAYIFCSFNKARGVQRYARYYASVLYFYLLGLMNSSYGRTLFYVSKFLIDSLRVQIATATNVKQNIPTTMFNAIIQQRLIKNMNCFESFDTLCRKIVSPTRHHLNEQDMINRKFRGKPIPYKKLLIKNKRNQYLSAIFFPNLVTNNNLYCYPTILYLHGNGGNKLEVLNIIKHTQLGQFNFFAFDFSGCGKSEGQFVTYGQQQIQDMETILKFLRDQHKIRKVSLWGRSMGASLSLMYAAIHPEQVEAIILDSPFKQLKKVLFNIATNNQKQVPQFLINFAIYLVEKKIEGMTQKDIFSCDYSQSFESLNQRNIPMIFSYSLKDTVVTSQDVLELYQNYKGRKKLIQFNCGHAEDRSKQFVTECILFLKKIYEEKATLTMMKLKQKQVQQIPQQTYWIQPKRKPGIIISHKIT